MLKKYNLRPSRGLGQNFLIDKTAVGKTITAADLQPNDIVLEIGPGLGGLTQDLAKRVKKVIAIEKDPSLVKVLNNELRIKNIKNVEIVQGDILKILDSKLLIHNSYKVVGNLPFYLTAPLIRKFLEIDAPPKLMVLIIQKEVAQRVCAKVPDMNLLAVSAQFYTEPRIISYISQKSFWPQPEVDAAIIKIEIKSSKLKVNRDLFFKIVKAGFCQPRKQLINNLSKGLGADKIKTEAWLWKNNIQPSQRAETLSIEDWAKLTKNFK